MSDDQNIPTPPASGSSIAEQPPLVSAIMVSCLKERPHLAAIAFSRWLRQSYPQQEDEPIPPGSPAWSL